MSSDSKPVLLSILIVNWRSKDYLRRCLKTVQVTCMDLSPQIVVVDGGSFDGCGEMLAVEFPDVEFVQSPDNVGFGRSNNLGFTKVRGKFLLLLNPDTELRPRSLERMIAAMDALPEAGILGPRLLNTDGSLQVYCVRALPTPFNRAVDSNLFRNLFPRSGMWGSLAAFESPVPAPVEAVSGACMLIQAETFRRVNGFSPQYFMYGEDMDLCAKVRAAGWRVFHVPDAEVVHHGGGSSKEQVNLFATEKMRESWDIYMTLNRGPFSVFLYRLLQLISAIIRMAISSVGYCFSSGRRKLRFSVSLKKWFCVLRWALSAMTGYGRGTRIR